jgi:flagellar protein FliO/FliZ
MAVVETLVLDPTRRVVLISVDGQEKLILLGEGRELAHAPVPPEAVA